MSADKAAKQAYFDELAASRARPANFGAIDEPLTGEIARAIDDQAPGTVRYIGRRIVNPNSVHVHELTDLDIVTDDVVIQVKSSGTRHLSEQLDKSRLVTSKPVIAYAPEMDDSTYARYRRSGYTVFRELPDLLRFLRERS